MHPHIIVVKIIIVRRTYARIHTHNIDFYLFSIQCTMDIQQFINVEGWHEKVGLGRLDVFALFSIKFSLHFRVD